MEKKKQILTVDQSRKEMANVARQILDGRIGIIAGAREITRLRLPSRAETNTDILVLMRIDGETVNFPLGEVRKHWNSEILKIKDEEIKNYEAKVRKRAFTACKNLIVSFERTI